MSRKERRSFAKRGKIFIIRFSDVLEVLEKKEAVKAKAKVYNKYIFSNAIFQGGEKNDRNIMEARSAQRR